MAKSPEALTLLDPSVLENLPAIKKLLGQFKEMLPAHFGKPYAVPSTFDSGLEIVLRANCGNRGCSVRAVVHLGRDQSGRLKIQEEKPLFDRLNNPCNQCQSFLGLP